MHRANFEFLIEPGEKFIVSDKFIDDERKITKGRGMFKKKKIAKRTHKKKKHLANTWMRIEKQFFLFNFLISPRLSFFQLNRTPLLAFLPLLYNDENVKN